MNPDYWLGRWQRGETGWHQKEVESALVRHFGDLSPTRVLVPLCGKSLDLAWLAERGHDVAGVELSERAVREFYAERGIEPTHARVGELTRWRGGGVTIWNGDFFALRPGDLGPVGAVYDRAALIALPKGMRPRYAEKLIELTTRRAPDHDGPVFRFLQIVLERTPHDEEGPPHSVPEAELRALYRDAFAVRPLSREPVDMGDEDGTVTEERVYLLEDLA